MATVIVLGGSGAVGSVAVRTLVKSSEFSEIVIGDYNLNGAQELVKELAAPGVSSTFVDVRNPESIHNALTGCDLVLNCVGPFYNTVKPVLSCVLAHKINYVDVCDDVDVTLELLDMSEQYRQAGVKVLLGMGNSPGITNLLGKLASDILLDETTSIDIFHTHGGEKVEGEGVIGHRFHCMTIDCPMYLEGRLQYVKYFEPDGIALRESFDFPVMGQVPLYPYPHPEQVTLPRHIPLKQVTNKGSVIPNAYYDLTRDLCGLGLSSKTPLKVKGQEMVPYDFAVSFILKERERLLQEAGLEAPRGCVSIIVKGMKNNLYQEFRFHLLSESEGLGEGTGIPAAVGAIMMNRGLVQEAGVMPPEAAVSPLEFLKVTSEVYDLTGTKPQKGETGRVLLEMVDPNGHITPLDISQFGIF